MPAKLSDLEISGRWGRSRLVTARRYPREDAPVPDVRRGIACVGRVAKVADRMDHHPDIDIRYTKVTFTLSTHSAGGLTQLDLDLASAIEQTLAA